MITLLILFSLIFSECRPCYVEKEIDMIYSMAQHFNVRFVTLASTFCERISALSSQVKYFSKKNMFAVLIDISELRSFFRKVNFSNVRTMMVFKVRNNEEQNEISKWLKYEVPNHVEFKWIMFLPKGSNKTTEKDFNVPYDCEFFIAREYQNGYDLTEIYQIKPTTNMIHSNFGFWNYEQGLASSGKYLYERRRNHKGTKMILSSYSELPCLFTMECLQLKMWYGMSEMMNITSKIYPKAELDSKNETGDLQSNMAAFHYYDIGSRYIVAPVLAAQWHMYIRYELDVSTGWGAYVRPFDSFLWYAIILWLVLLTCGRMIMGRIYLANLRLKGFTIIDEGFITLAAICNQAHPGEPDIFSSKITKLSIFIASIVIVPAYGAAITSSLTVQLPNIPFTDLETFAKDGTYKLASTYHPFAVTFFNLSTDPLVKKIRDKLLVPYSEFPWGEPVALEMLCTRNKLAMMSFNYEFDKIVKPTCSYFRVSETILYVFGGIRLSPHLIGHKNILLDLISKFRTSGLITRAQMVLFAKKSFQKEEKFEPIDLSNTRLSCSIVLLGIVCSLIVSVLEKIFKFITNKELKNNAQDLINMKHRQEGAFTYLNRNRRYINSMQLEGF